jgi:hypothetical protein
MRVVQAAALTAAALLLTSVASAQGLGDAAAAARQKRQAEPAKPAKVYTDGDIGESMTPVTTTRDLPATAAPATSTPATGGGAAAGSQPAGEARPPAEGQPAAEGQAPAGDAAPAEGAAGAGAADDAAKAAAEAEAQAQATWRTSLDQARKEEAAYKDMVDKLQFQMNGTAGLYSPGRAANATALEQYKQKLADARAKIATLEDEGRRKGYR